MSVLSASASAYAPSTRVPLAAAALLAVPAGGAIGVGLGWWCRRTAGEASAAGVLAEMGAPWILAAFVAGAVPMLLGTGRRVVATFGYQFGAAVVGAIAGATCLVAATVVYYGPARTGRLDVAGAGSATVVWTAVGIAVGVTFGAAGALWWAAPTRAQAAAALVAVGVAMTSEAYYLLDAGVSSEPLARNVFVLVAIAGAAMPLLLGLRWPAIVGIAVVAVAALPGALAAEIVWQGALEGVAQVRTYARTP